MRCISYENHQESHTITILQTLLPNDRRVKKNLVEGLTEVVLTIEPIELIRHTQKLRHRVALHHRQQIGQPSDFSSFVFSLCPTSLDHSVLLN